MKKVLKKDQEAMSVLNTITPLKSRGGRKPGNINALDSVTNAILDSESGESDEDYE